VLDLTDPSLFRTVGIKQNRRPLPTLEDEGRSILIEVVIP
jgi:hypothetical protein